jgi:hypothetical protein
MLWGSQMMGWNRWMGSQPSFLPFFILSFLSFQKRSEKNKGQQSEGTCFLCPNSQLLASCDAIRCCLLFFLLWSDVWPQGLASALSLDSYP